MTATIQKSTGKIIAAGEKVVRKAIEGGMSSTEAFANSEFFSDSREKIITNYLHKCQKKLRILVSSF